MKWWEKISVFLKMPGFRAALCIAVENELKQKFNVPFAKCYLSPSVVEWGREVFQRQPRDMQKVVVLDLAYLIVKNGASGRVSSSNSAIQIVSFDSLKQAAGPLRIFDRMVQLPWEAVLSRICAPSSP